MSHTPGPWEITYGGKDGDGFATIGSKFRNFSVAELTARDSKENILEPEMLANARLIAAAPDLLEACRDCLAIAEKAFQIVPASVRRESIDKARAAIAKAGGRG